jgi:hypothetical protein
VLVFERSFQLLNILVGSQFLKIYWVYELYEMFDVFFSLGNFYSMATSRDLVSYV